jgi:hypothetical protein
MDKQLKDLEGVTCFLNGQEGLHTLEERLLSKLTDLGKDVLVLDDLFEQPHRLVEVVKCKNLVLSTTGLYVDNLTKLVAGFEKLNYAPEVVIFLTENTALALLGTAREYKLKGTKFYFTLDSFLVEYSWI